jgi:hypothetical protein
MYTGFVCDHNEISHYMTGIKKSYGLGRIWTRFISPGIREISENKI